MTGPATDKAIRRRRWYMLGALVTAAIAFAVIAASGINENLVYYWSPTDLRAAGDKAYGATIRLGGQVRPGTIRQAATSNLAFEVTDRKTNVPVRTTGLPPQMFRDGIGVVVEGTMTREGVFQGDRLMISHDNEYRAPKEGQTIDTKTLMKSTKGIDSE